MNGVNLPFLPASLWIMAGALTILLLIIVLGYYAYWRKRENALLKSVDNAAELAAQEQILRADMEAIRKWIDDQKVELERLNSERDHQERLRSTLSDLEQQCARKDQENQALRNEVGELENQRYILTQTLENTKKEIGNIEAKRADAQVIEQRLSELRAKHEQAKLAIKNLAELEVRNDILSRENKRLEDTVILFKEEKESAKFDMEKYKLQAGEARIEAENEKKVLLEMSKEKSELGVIIETLRHEQTALNRDIERLEEKMIHGKQLSKDALSEMRKNFELKKKSEDEVIKATNELMALQKDKRLTEIELSELRTLKAVMRQEVKRLEGDLKGSSNDDVDHFKPYADLLINAPTCLIETAFKSQRDVTDEVSVLQEVQSKLRKDGLIFPSRVIYAFHTSLKCHDINPLTVLAGVSGTGKTLLPMRYAELMGMHRLVMAVQPRWDSPQDMFGFYNYLEKEYKATDLSRSLIRMDPYNYNGNGFKELINSAWAKERVLLVLLDEMNLARTEYYFSDFLSKLELRREVRDPSLKHDRSQAEIELDTGSGKTRFQIWVGNNVLFVGTMNEDETTQSLSDKVLDRANVIRFGKPDERARSNRSLNIRNGSSSFLTIRQWQDWQKQTTGREEWHEGVVNLTRRLNSAMDRIGRPFGFRVQQAIEHYVNNYPSVSEHNRYKLAMADQLEQKIIPKLRGLDIHSDNANQCLSEIENTIADLDDDELGTAFESARTESSEVGMFQWRGVTRKYEEIQA